MQNGINKLSECFNGTLDFPMLPNIYQITNMSLEGRLLPPITTKYMLAIKDFLKPKTKKERRFKKFILAAVVKIYAKLN